MPSTKTITSSDVVTAVARAKIKSADWNSTISVFRGHLLPVTTDTSTASDLTYDLGDYSYSWANSFHQITVMNDVATPANPTAGFYKLYFKSDGNIYKLNSSGTETQIDAAVTPISVVSTSGGFSIGSQDVVILNPSGGALTCTLPSAATATKRLFIKNSTLNAGSNVITIDAPTTQTIDDTLTTTLNTGGEVLELAPDGTNWQIISRRNNIHIGTETWTDSQVNATTSVIVTRQGQWVRAVGKATFTGAATATDYEVTVPSAYTPDTTNYASPAVHNYYPLGTAKFNDVGTLWHEGWVNLSAATTLRIMIGNVASTYLSSNNVAATVPFTWANTDTINWEATWKVSGWK